MFILSIRQSRKYILFYINPNIWLNNVVARVLTMWNIVLFSKNSSSKSWRTFIACYTFHVETVNFTKHKTKNFLKQGKQLSTYSFKYHTTVSYLCTMIILTCFLLSEWMQKVGRWDQFYFKYNNTAMNKKLYRQNWNLMLNCTLK